MGALSYSRLGLFLLLANKAPIAASKSIAPTAAPIPIPAFAPVDSPEPELLLLAKTLLEGMREEDASCKADEAPEKAEADILDKELARIPAALSEADEVEEEAPEEVDEGLPEVAIEATDVGAAVELNTAPVLAVLAALVLALLTERADDADARLA